MKAVLQFDYDKPDERLDHIKAVFANDMAFVIWNLKHNVIRSIIKNELTLDDAMDRIREELDNLPFDIDEVTR
jgi:hypothetical protein